MNKRQKSNDNDNESIQIMDNINTYNKNILNMNISLPLEDIINIIDYYFNNKNYYNIINLYSNNKNNIINNITNKIILNTLLLYIGISYTELKNYSDAIETYNLIDINFSYDSYKFNLYKQFNLISNDMLSIVFIKYFLIGLTYKLNSQYLLSKEYFNKYINDIIPDSFRNLTYKFLLEIYDKINDKTNIDLLQIINIHKYYNNYEKVIDNLKLLNYLQKEINIYIKDILQIDIHLLLLDNINIDYILENFKILEDEDIIFIAEKYYELNKHNKIRELINNNFKDYKPEIKIIILSKLLINDYKNKKLCEDIFKNYNKIENKTNDIENILISTKIYYNDIIITNIYNYNLEDIKYPEFLNKQNLDLINNQYCKFLYLQNMFKKDSVKDKCLICLEDNNYVIVLNCHNTHMICYKCYNKINSCPLCREKIFK